MRRIVALSLFIFLIYSAVSGQGLAIEMNKQNLHISIAGSEMTLSLLTVAAIVGISLIIYYLLSSSGREERRTKVKNEILPDLALSTDEVPPSPVFENRLLLVQDQRNMILKQAIKYALFIGILSAVYRNYALFDIPIYTLLLLALLDVIIGAMVAFPALWLFFHFKESGTVEGVKKKVAVTVCNRVCAVDVSDRANLMRRYYEMLQDGIITQEEFNRFKTIKMKEAER